MNRSLFLVVLFLAALSTQAQQVPRRSILALTGEIGLSSTLISPRVTHLKGPYVLQPEKVENPECYDDYGNLVECNGSGRHVGLGLLYRRDNQSRTGGWMVYSGLNLHEQEFTLNYPSNRNFHIPVNCTPSIRRILRAPGATFQVGRYWNLNAGNGVFFARFGGRIATRFQYLRGVYPTRLPDLRPLEYLQYGSGTVIEMYDNTPKYNILATPEIGITLEDSPVEIAVSAHLPVYNPTVFSELHTFAENRYIVGQNRVDYTNAVINLTLRAGVNLLSKYRRAPRPRYRPAPPPRTPAPRSDPVYTSPVEPTRPKAPPSRFANQPLNRPITLLVHFELTKADLLPASYPDLNELVQWLKDNPQAMIRLEGHTDLIGDEDKNLELSRERVVEVKNYLSLKGVASHRVDVAFFGEKRPLKTNCPPPHYCPENRRVEMIILKR